MTLTASMTAETLSAATPKNRDRYIDLVRAVSICVVIFGHWLITVIRWGDPPSPDNLLAVAPWLQPITWLLQIMPLFFVVGGFSNALSLASTRRRGGGYADFLYHRLERLLRPVAVFLAVWVAVAASLLWVAPTHPVVGLAAVISVQPLWFIGLYVLVIALAPLTLAAHRRFGLAVPLALAGAVALVDWTRMNTDLAMIGALNFALVWLFAHQLGYFYADGRLLRLGRGALLGLAVAALAALILLTTMGPYPMSMVGLPNATFSNMSPPSLCIVALTVWLLALAMLLRGPATRLLERVRVWAAVVQVNSVIMTIFLWHLTALLVSLSVVFWLGLSIPDVGTAGWWLLRPVWLAVLLAVLLGFVALFGRVERMPPSQSTLVGPGRPRTALAALGGTWVIIGVCGVALNGLAGLLTGERAALILLSVTPVLSLLALGLGTALVRVAIQPHGRRVGFLAALVFALLALAEAAGAGSAAGSLPSAVMYGLTAATVAWAAWAMRPAIPPLTMEPPPIAP
ncbi:MAG: acyltransferase [Anaerolineae bacterium]|nr:acyltransferase [Anaerolineae bacterium]